MIFTIAWASWRKSDDNKHGHGHSHEEEPAHAHGHEKHDDVLLSPRKSARALASDRKNK